MGQLTGESKPQVVDATEGVESNKVWTEGRNAGMPNNGLYIEANIGRVNQTFAPFSRSTVPTLQMQIDFAELDENYGGPR